MDNIGLLPIHHACTSHSPEFCRVLIEAYPGSERITDVDAILPIIMLPSVTRTLNNTGAYLTWHAGVMNMLV
jgi:hypothetical protein